MLQVGDQLTNAYTRFKSEIDLDGSAGSISKDLIIVDQTSFSRRVLNGLAEKVDCTTIEIFCQDSFEIDDLNSLEKAAGIKNEMLDLFKKYRFNLIINTVSSKALSIIISELAVVYSSNLLYVQEDLLESKVITLYPKLPLNVFISLPNEEFGNFLELSSHNTLVTGYPLCSAFELTKEDLAQEIVQIKQRFEIQDGQKVILVKLDNPTQELLDSLKSVADHLVVISNQPIPSTHHISADDIIDLVSVMYFADLLVSNATPETIHQAEKTGVPLLMIQDDVKTYYQRYAEKNGVGDTALPDTFLHQVQESLNGPRRDPTTSKVRWVDQILDFKMRQCESPKKTSATTATIKYHLDLQERLLADKLTFVERMMLFGLEKALYVSMDAAVSQYSAREDKLLEAIEHGNNFKAFEIIKQILIPEQRGIIPTLLQNTASYLKLDKSVAPYIPALLKKVSPQPRFRQKIHQIGKKVTRLPKRFFIINEYKTDQVLQLAQAAIDQPLKIKQDGQSILTVDLKPYYNQVRDYFEQPEAEEPQQNSNILPIAIGGISALALGYGIHRITSKKQKT